MTRTKQIAGNSKLRLLSKAEATIKEYRLLEEKQEENEDMTEKLARSNTENVSSFIVK
jgi:hypothetical protein